MTALVPLDHWPVEQYAVGGQLPAHYRRTPGADDWGQPSAIGSLLFSETVGPDLVVAYCIGPRTSVALVRAGAVRHVQRIRAPYPDTMDPNEHDMAEFDLAVRTAEAAVLTLRERTAPGRTTPEAEAWLRRQLAGLGKATR